MTCSRVLPVLFAVAAVVAVSAPAEAQRRAVPREGGGGRPGGGRPGAPVYVQPRRPIIVAPRIVGAPYRPYYRYRPGFTVGFYSGYPYGYPYYSGYGYGYGYYPYSYPYSYPYAPAGYVAAVPGVYYGGVRIQDAPRDAQVFADGYYVGIVNDFDGVFQHLNLTAGPHRIEIRAPGWPPMSFDVNVPPGQTLTLHVPRQP